MQEWEKAVVGEGSSGRRQVDRRRGKYGRRVGKRVLGDGICSVGGRYRRW